MHIQNINLNIFNGMILIVCAIMHLVHLIKFGARCSSVVRAFAHGAMGRRIDPSWGGPIELFLVPASAGVVYYIYILRTHSAHCY